MEYNDKLMFAQLYISKMADGINPLNDEAVKDGDLINNVHISRCLYFVSDVLKQIIEGESSKEKKKVISQFFITDEQRKLLTPFDRYVFSRDVAEKINEVTSENNCKSFNARWILEYLLSIGMLELSNGRKIPTEEGEIFGIKAEIRTDSNNQAYKVNKLSPDVQQFIFDNIDAIINFVTSEEYKKQIRKNRITD